MEGITINYIRDILKSYADSLRQYDSVDEKELWLQKVAQARSAFLECLRMMSNIYPELLQVNMPAFMWVGAMPVAPEPQCKLMTIPIQILPMI